MRRSRGLRFVEIVTLSQDLSLTNILYSLQLAVLVHGIQNNINHIKNAHTKTMYFSRETRAVNFDNIVPYDELSTDRSDYLIGQNRDSVKIDVIIVPMQQNIVQESPSYDFK